MCNLYSMISNREAIRAFTRAMMDNVGNMPPPGLFPGYSAPIARPKIDLVTKRTVGKSWTARTEKSGHKRMRDDG